MPFHHFLLGLDEKLDECAQLHGFSSISDVGRVSTFLTHIPGFTMTLQCNVYLPHETTKCGIGSGTGANREEHARLKFTRLPSSAWIGLPYLAILVFQLGLWLRNSYVLNPQPPGATSIEIPHAADKPG